VCTGDLANAVMSAIICSSGIVKLLIQNSQRSLFRDDPPTIRHLWLSASEASQHYSSRGERQHIFPRGSGSRMFSLSSASLVGKTSAGPRKKKIEREK
jgi:hypothetical protein